MRYQPGRGGDDPGRHQVAAIPWPRVKQEVEMSANAAESETLLTPSEVAVLFRVDPKTVTRWAKAGKLSSIRTLGGHRRYRESEVRDLLAGIPQQRPSDA